MKILRQLLIWLDQGLNVLLAGYADETISARAYRNRYKKYWNKAYKVINSIFFLQEDHCKESFNRELKRLHLPREYRE